MEAITLKTRRKGQATSRCMATKRSRHPSYADKEFPFRYQGAADLNTYKLFLEVAYHLLKHKGRFGMLVPSSVYTDHGSIALRRLFLIIATGNGSLAL